MRSALADRQTSKAGRPLLWAAGLSLCLVAVVVVLLTRGGRHDVEPRRIEAVRASPAQAATAIRSFVDGVDARDGAALAALAPDEDRAAQAVLTGIGANAAALDLRRVSARYVDQVGTVAADGSWTGIAEIAWQLGGFDAVPSRAEVLVSFAPDGDGLGIVGFEPGARTDRARVPLWLRGALSVVERPGVLVLVDGPQRRADEVAQRAARGIGVVRRVLTGWRSPVVVEVPASGAELDETLGASSGTYAGIAAVTTTAGSGTEPDAPVHVFVNPEVTDGLRRAGAQVVMSHELVHVATDAARGAVEPWLVEGFADYVALRDVDLPDATTLGRAIDVVRRDGVPDSLPSAADFDTRAADLQASYEQAWLACRIIAETLGERGLLSVYDAASAGEPTDRALRIAGLAEDDLTAVWRDRLADLAR